VSEGRKKKKKKKKKKNLKREKKEREKTGKGRSTYVFIVQRVLGTLTCEQAGGPNTCWEKKGIPVGGGDSYEGMESLLSPKREKERVKTLREGGTHSSRKKLIILFGENVFAPFPPDGG